MLNSRPPESLRSGQSSRLVNSEDMPHRVPSMFCSRLYCLPRSPYKRGTAGCRRGIWPDCRKAVSVTHRRDTYLACKDSTVTHIPHTCMRVMAGLQKRPRE